MTSVVCGWCQEGFDMKTVRGKWGYGTQICPNCARMVRSSRKEPTDKTSNRKHIHLDLRKGDIV